MVLAGLVIALGEVVDDAIIDVENIVRRLRLNANSPQPLAAFRVVLDASLEVRSAVVYATLIVILAFIPVLFLTGLAGAFFQPLAMAYVIAILASLVVAMIVTPAMAYMLLPQAAHRESRESAGLSRQRRLRRLLPPCPSPWRHAGPCCRGLRAACRPDSAAGRGAPAELQGADFLMHWVEKPGTSASRP